jgi:hypothetical protein
MAALMAAIRAMALKNGFIIAPFATGFIVSGCKFRTVDSY